MSVTEAVAATEEFAPDLRTMRRDSVRGAAVTFAAQGLRFFLQFGSQLVLARLLLPAEFGLVAMITPVFNLVQTVNDLGLSQATIQRPTITQQQLSGLFWVNVLLGAALALAMGAAAPLVAMFYGQPGLAEICRAVAVLLFLSGLAAQHIALLNRRMQFSALAMIDIACGGVSVAVGVSAAALGFGAWSLVAMQAANSLTILVLAWSLSGWRPSFPSLERSLSGLLGFGGAVTASNLVTYLSLNLDSVLLGRFAGEVALGLYDRAFKLIASPMWQITLPVARVAVSLLARLHGQPERYRSAYMQMLQLLLLVTVPAALFVAVTADGLVPLLLGPDWVNAVPIARWLAVSTAFAPLGNSAYWLYLSQARGRAQLRYSTIKLLAGATALVAGLPWGAAGVAVAYAIAAPVVQGVFLHGAVRTGPVRWRDVITACSPVALAGAIGAVAVVSIEPWLGGMPLFSRLLAGGVLACAAVGLGLLPFRSGRETIGRLWRVRTLIAGHS